ncbi:MAG: helix-turn-helix transcriptional regulator [Capnocytophaga sp.]|nr:helix-turn-helix transcriptional regulator [Capnocytophaga sp.]
MNVLIGKKIRQLRKKKGLTQEQMADLLAISQPAYTRMENGETYSWSAFILRFSHIFQIPIVEIFNFDDFDNTSYTPKDFIVNPIAIQLIKALECEIQSYKSLVAELKKEIDFLKKEQEDTKNNTKKRKEK